MTFVRLCARNDWETDAAQQYDALVAIRGIGKKTAMKARTAVIPLSHRQLCCRSSRPPRPGPIDVSSSRAKRTVSVSSSSAYTVSCLLVLSY